MTAIYSTRSERRPRLVTDHIYVRPPRPIEFPAFEPEEERVSENKRHMENRTALFQLLQDLFGATCSIGSDQFVYYDRTDPRRCLSPDVFVKLDIPDEPFPIWKTWEHGPPDLGVELISDSDHRDANWEEKLARYRAAGVLELVRFDAQDEEKPIRIWDDVDGDLVERAENDPNLRLCHTLDLWWVVREDPIIGPMLRLARDPKGQDVLPTRQEAKLLAQERLREETAARQRAEREIQALKEALAKAQRGG